MGDILVCCHVLPWESWCLLPRELSRSLPALRGFPRVLYLSSQSPYSYASHPWPYTHLFLVLSGFCPASHLFTPLLLTPGPYHQYLGFIFPSENLPWAVRWEVTGLDREDSPTQPGCTEAQASVIREEELGGGVDRGH